MGPPGAWVLNVEDEGSAAMSGGLNRRHFMLTVQERRFKRQPPPGLVDDRDHHQASVVQIGDDMHRLDIAGGDGLQPDRLPDAGGAGVTRPVGAQLLALLARRLAT